MDQHLRLAQQALSDVTVHLLAAGDAATREGQPLDMQNLTYTAQALSHDILGVVVALRTRLNAS